MKTLKQYTDKQIKKADRAFESACKAASRCRYDKRLVSCFACPQYDNCPIQERVNKNLAVKRGEVYTKNND
jgi:hypothetical protein